MSKRIVTPINADAFAAAKLEFENKYRTKLPLVPGTRNHRNLRDKWLEMYKSKGGELIEDDTAYQEKDPLSATSPCPLKNNIESVHILDGNNTTFLTADANQHVNLPDDAKFIDGIIVPNKHRTGRTIKVAIKFKRQKVERFKVALLAHTDNIDYSDEEKGRRPNFNYTRTEAEDPHKMGSFDHYHGQVFASQTNKKGIAIVNENLETTPAGGDKYKVVAWDVDGNVVFSSAEITTTRTLYYSTFLADDPSGSRLDQGFFRTQLQQCYAGHHINLVWVGEENLDGVIYHDTIMGLHAADAIQKAALENNCSRGIPYRSLEPYLLKFAFVDHIADALLKKITPSKHLKVNSGDEIYIPIFTSTEDQRKRDRNFDWRKCLWKGLGKSLDTRCQLETSDWFKSATLTIGGIPHDMVESDFDLIPRSAGEPDAIVGFNLTLPEIPDNSDVTVNMEIVIFNAARMGQSLTGANKGITIQPSRNKCVPIDEKKQVSSAIHELGHAIGMVAREQKQGLEHETFYDHNGAHCWNGVITSDPLPPAPPLPALKGPADYHKIPRKDTGTCVMYGLIPVGRDPNMDFCPNCSKALSKLDLSEGYTG